MGKMIVEQKKELRRIQLQTLFVNVQSFIHQLADPSLKEVINYIEDKDSNIFPADVKEIVKHELALEYK